MYLNDFLVTEYLVTICVVILLVREILVSELCGSLKCIGPSLHKTLVKPQYHIKSIILCQIKQCQTNKFAKFYGYTSSLTASLMQLFPKNPAVAAEPAVTAVITWQ